MRTSVPEGDPPEMAIVPPSPSMMFRAIASPSPVPPLRVVKNGSNSRAAAAGIDSRAVVVNDDDHAAALVGRRPQRDGAAVGLGGMLCNAPRGAHRLGGILQHVDQHRAQAFGVRPDWGQRRREHGPDRDAGAAGLHGPRRLAADRVRVRVLPREREGLRVVEHLGHDPVEAHDLLVDVPDRLLARVIASLGLPQGPCRGLDDHQRVADLVGDDTGQAAERRQPFALRGFLLETRDGVGERVERRRQQACVFVLPGPRSHGDLAGEVAGGGDLAHHAGDRAERLRDRPRDGIAEHGRQQHRQERGRADDRLDGAEEPQLLGPRPNHHHERRALRPAARPGRRRRAPA